MKLLYKSFLLIGFILFIYACNNDDDSNSENDPRSENTKSLGVSANHLLADDTYTSLTIELAYSNGFRPLQESIDAFKDFLEARLNKPDGITFIETEIITPLDNTQSLDDILDIESEQRTQYTVGDDIAVFIYFTHASSDSDTNTSKTLGTAYLNTSMVVYENTLRNLQQSQGFDLFVLEEATMQHEFGHLLGLVNLRDDDIHSENEHEDPLHSHHCIVENCLMYYASTRRPLEYFRNRRTVPQLDPLCIEDLQAKGGK